MSKEIKLITKGATEQISTIIVGASRMGNPLIIKAQNGVHYELRDATTHFAPHQVLLVRKGKDLMIKIGPKEDESDKNAPADIIIQNYYGESGDSLVGMSEDGQYYNYVPQEGNSDLFSMNMDNDGSSYQSLGYSDVTTETNWLPYAIGALALGALAAAVGGGGGNKSSDTTNNAPTDAPVITDTTPPTTVNTNNITVDSGTVSDFITIDTTAPALTAGLDPTSDSGIVGDGITSDTTPTISGTGESGDPLSVVINGQTITTTVAENGNWSVTAATLADGIYTAAVTETDIAGNTTTANVPITIDATANTIEITGISVDSGIPGDFITNDNNGLNISATLGTNLASNEGLYYSNDGVNWADISSFVTGTDVSFSDSSLTSTDTIYMIVIDAAGNYNLDSQLITIDYTSPALTAGLDPTSDSGIVGDGITSDTTPTISGTGESGDPLSVVINGQTITTTVAENGNWSVTAATLADGIYTAAVTETDIAGNTTTANVPITIDATANTIEITGISVDSGIPGDFITNDNNGLNISATLGTNLASNEGLYYSNDGVNWADISSFVTGTDVSFSDSSLTSTDTIYMIVIDAAGNYNLDSQLITIDYTSPALTAGLDPTSDSGIVGDGITSDTTPTISGTGESGDPLSVVINGQTITTTVAENGNWSVTAATLADGIYTAAVTETDIAGNTTTANVPITIDATANTIEITGISVDSGIPGDFITNDNNGLNISATLGTNLASNEGLYYSNDGVNWADISSFVTGTDVSFSDSSLTSTDTIYMIVIDAAGNYNLDSQLITIDYTSPALTAGLDPTSDSGIVGDGITSDTTPTISGTGESGDPLSVVINGQTITTTVAENGNWSVTAATLADGIYTAAVTETDIAGNTTTANVPITIDATANTIEITGISVDSGIPGDFITNDNNGLNISATLGTNLASNEGLYYSNDGVNWADISSFVTGTDVSFSDSSLTSTDTIYMIVIDAAGNYNLDSQLITIDYTSPALTAGLDPTSDSGIVGDGITSDTTPTISGTGESGDPLSVVINGQTITTTVAENGNWSVTAATLADGIYTAAVTETDIAGNTTTANVPITIDATANTIEITGISVDSGIPGDFITNDNNGLNISATLGTNLASNEGLYYSNDGVNWADISSFVTGTDVSFSDSSLTSTDTIYMIVIDAAGNYNLDSQLITIDTTPPQTAAPIIITLDTNNDGIISQSEKGSAITTNVTVGIPSDAQTGDVVTARNELTGSVIATYTVGTNANAGDTKTITGVALPTGSNTLTVTTSIHDAAGNIGPSASDSAIMNQAPIVSASDSTLLGLVGLEALGLLDLSHQAVAAIDPNNNIKTVVVKYDALVSVGLHELAASSAMAAELGLTFTVNNDLGLLGLGLLGTSSTITITAIGGGAIDNQKLNELLSTVHFTNPTLSVNVLDALSITATDTNGLSATDSSIGLTNISLLHTQQTTSGVQEGTSGNDTIAGTADADRLYGYAGNDTLSGLEGSDVLRGGDGTDTLYGEDGNDLLIGGNGADTIYGGNGDDQIEWDPSDVLISGGAGFDTLYLSGSGITLDLSTVTGSKVTGIEKIDLTGNGDNHLVVSYNDVIALNNGSDTLYVSGNQGDTVDLTGQVFIGSQTVDGIIYNTYNIGGTNALDIWVQQDIKVI